jgi:hypothetical protein
MVGSLCLRGLPTALPSLFIGIALFAVALAIADSIDGTDPNSNDFNDLEYWTVTTDNRLNGSCFGSYVYNSDSGETENEFQ